MEFITVLQIHIKIPKLKSTSKPTGKETHHLYCIPSCRCSYFSSLASLQATKQKSVIYPRSSSLPKSPYQISRKFLIILFLFYPFFSIVPYTICFQALTIPSISSNLRKLIAHTLLMELVIQRSLKYEVSEKSLKERYCLRRISSREKNINKYKRFRKLDKMLLLRKLLTCYSSYF